MAEELEVEFSEIEAIEKSEPKQEKKEPELPEKYRGKSIEDVVKMHQEAEKLASRHSQEVGEVRRLADELLKAQLAKKPEVEKPEEIDFFDNPTEAINKAVSSNPRVLAAEQNALQVQREYSKQMFFAKHPDALNIAQDSEFQDWVGKSKVRQKLLRDADNYDFDAGDELIGTWKELKGIKQAQSKQVEKQAIDNVLKDASVDTGGSGESSRKVYRRADLIRLKMKDPAKYDAMYDDIMKAYADGRVR